MVGWFWFDAIYTNTSSEYEKWDVNDYDLDRGAMGLFILYPSNICYDDTLQVGWRDALWLVGLVSWSRNAIVSSYSYIGIANIGRLTDFYKSSWVKWQFFQPNESSRLFRIRILICGSNKLSPTIQVILSIALPYNPIKIFKK